MIERYKNLVLEQGGKMNVLWRIGAVVKCRHPIQKLVKAHYVLPERGVL